MFSTFFWIYHPDYCYSSSNLTICSVKQELFRLAPILLVFSQRYVDITTLRIYFAYLLIVRAVPEAAAAFFPQNWHGAATTLKTRQCEQGEKIRQEYYVTGHLDYRIRGNFSFYEFLNVFVRDFCIFVITECFGFEVIKDPFLILVPPCFIALRINQTLTSLFSPFLRMVFVTVIRRVSRHLLSLTP